MHCSIKLTWIVYFSGCEFCNLIRRLFVGFRFYLFIPKHSKMSRFFLCVCSVAKKSDSPGNRNVFQPRMDEFWFIKL